MNYEATLKNITLTQKEIILREKPRLDMLMIRSKPVDISMKKISKLLFGVGFEPAVKTLEYDYRMTKLKNVKKLSS